MMATLAFNELNNLRFSILVLTDEDVVNFATHVHVIYRQENFFMK